MRQSYPFIFVPFFTFCYITEVYIEKHGMDTTLLDSLPPSIYIIKLTDYFYVTVIAFKNFFQFFTVTGKIINYNDLQLITHIVYSSG